MLQVIDELNFIFVAKEKVRLRNSLGEAGDKRTSFNYSFFRGSRKGGS